MQRTAWTMLKQTGVEYMDDNALSRGAAIAYYTLFSLAPILVIAIAIAGLVFGHDAANGALAGQLQGLMGKQGADLVQSMVQSASGKQAGILATVIGFVILMVTATGVFSELQADLNAIWKADASAGVSAMVKTRALGLGLVAALGFLLIVSLLVSAGLAGLGKYLHGMFPGAVLLFQLLNFVISFALVSVMFAAIYKVLPDKELGWHDVSVGAVATAFLFTIGKFLIGLYIGKTAVASSYGAAGAAMVVLVWIYYSALIFLLGAEFTKVYARHHGSPEAPPHPAAPITVAPAPVQPRRRPWSRLDVVAYGALAVALIRETRRR